MVRILFAGSGTTQATVISNDSCTWVFRKLDLNVRAYVPKIELYREAESYGSHHQTTKHQCTRLSSVPNLNSQASNPISVG